MQFELSANGHWLCDYRLPFWQGFASANNDYAALGDDVSDGTVAIIFGPDGRREHAPLTATEQILIDWFAQHHELLSQHVLHAIFEYYQQQRQELISWPFFSGHMPEITEPQQLKPLLGLSQVFIHHRHNGSKLPYIGMLFGCSWDDEHGLGVQTEGLTVQAIGGADCAFLFPSATAPVVISLADIDSEAQLQRKLAEALQFGEFYGHNWDAFWDMISASVSLPDEIIFTDTAVLTRKLPEATTQLKLLFQRLAQEYPSLPHNISWR